MKVRKGGQALPFTHAGCQRQRHTGVAFREICDTPGVAFADIRVAPPDKNFGDTRSFGMDLDDRGVFRPVVANVEIDTDQKDVRGLRNQFGEFVVSIPGTVV